jgi:hypothetical protein
MTDAATQMEQRCGEEEDDQELLVAARSAIALAPPPKPSFSSSLKPAVLKRDQTQDKGRVATSAK